MPHKKTMMMVMEATKRRERSRNFQIQQEARETLAVSIQRQGAGNAATQCILDYEIQSSQLRQFMAHDIAIHCPCQASSHGFRRHSLPQQGKVVGPIGDGPN